LGIGAEEEGKRAAWCLLFSNASQGKGIPQLDSQRGKGERNGKKQARRNPKKENQGRRRGGGGKPTLFFSRVEGDVTGHSNHMEEGGGRGEKKKPVYRGIKRN